MPISKDISLDLQERVGSAAESKTPLQLIGGNSKEFLGRVPAGEPLMVNAHKGIVDYSPSELVVTARAGTTVSELQNLLAEENQVLGFEPPEFQGQATLGGTLATNLSGPARPWRGSIRDAVLGVRLINGLGEHLRFGGVVMKNVAGYDLSRFQAGAFGTLGIVTEISLKVAPKPAAEQTVCLARDQVSALDLMTKLQNKPVPLSGLLWIDGILYIRFSGAEAAVQSAAKRIGGERLMDKEATEFWMSVREFTHPFFSGPQPLWRYSVKSSCADFDKTPVLIDWGGGLRWTREAASMEPMRQFTEAGNGQVSCYRGGDRQGEVFQPLPPGLMRLHQRLKHAVDPLQLFNPGRLYADL